MKQIQRGVFLEPRAARHADLQRRFLGKDDVRGASQAKGLGEEMKIDKSHFEES